MFLIKRKYSIFIVLITLGMLNSFTTLMPNSDAPSLPAKCDKPSGLGFNFMGTKYTPFVFEDYYLKKFNLLTILSYEGMNHKSSRLVKVKCDCGNEKIMELDKVKFGRSKSCGCVSIQKSKDNAKHGMWNHPIYKCWIRMKSRCLNPKNISYNRYGGRGVKVCDEWRYSFINFYNWAKDKWEPELQLDKDIIGDGLLYSPDTCCFVTGLRNSREQEHCHRFTINGETKTIGEWCETYNASHKNVYSRVIEHGWDIEEALKDNVYKSPRNGCTKLTLEKINIIISKRNEGMSNVEISKIVGVSAAHVSKVYHNQEYYKSKL